MSHLAIHNGVVSEGYPCLGLTVSRACGQAGKYTETNTGA